MVVKEFMYKISEYVGDGWVFVGDVYGFIDLIYLLGVFLVLKLGEFVVDVIVDGLDVNDVLVW